MLTEHWHTVLYVHKLTTMRRALEGSNCPQGLGLEQGTVCHSPDSCKGSQERGLQSRSATASLLIKNYQFM